MPDLTRAEAHYEEARERYRNCCGGVVKTFEGEATHYYYHGKDFQFSYPPERDYPHPTHVEGGFVFYPDGARCYYIFDAETMSESFEFGLNGPSIGPDGLIPYAAPDFWERLDALVDTAAEVAFNSDIWSCTVCGYNYHAGNGPCCEEAGGGDDDDAADDGREG